MDKLQRQRRVKRTGFRKVCKEVSKMIASDQPNLTALEAKMSTLQDKYEELRKLDQEIGNELFNSCVDEKELEQEETLTDEIIDLFSLLKVQTKSLLQSEKSESSSTKSSEASCPARKRLNLPKLELKKFNGDSREWLPFWAQFSKIDAETTLDEAEKFQYLIQATVEGSKARELLKSYPPTAANYKEALGALKSRFGRDEVLVEVYVRELLGLVITNSRPGKKLPFSVLYDKIEAQLRALETLNVAPDTCAAMLYPLVESCLPEDVLRTWQRHQTTRPEPLTSDLSNTVTDGDEKKPSIAKERLSRLMLFLRSEVEGEERIAMAMAGFGAKEKVTEEKVRSGPVPTPNRPAAAAGLVNKTLGADTCVFCDKNHASAICEKAKTLPLSERGQILIKKGACLKCLKLGHVRKKCRTWIDCSNCGKGHVAVMCPTQKEDKVIERALTSLCTIKTVQLQILPIVIRGKKGEKIVRALLDTGSQRSYVSSGLAEKLGVEYIRKEKLAHSLFGGFETRPIEHNVFLLRVSSIERDFHCNFEVIDQQTICREMEPTTMNGVEKELEAAGVVLHDSQSGPIDVLIGADIYGKLMTGEVLKLSNGMTALKTLLGWTVIGKMTNSKKDSIATTATVSCLFATEPLARLWELEVIGIADPAAQVSENERLKGVKMWFENTIRRDEEGRYIVQLPWKSDHPPLPTNINLASRRTNNKLAQLERSGQLKSYQQVFHEWEEEGVIEMTTPEVMGHYLPHRPVIKEEGTTKIRPVFDASAREKGHPSLNDCLQIGENLIGMIPSILLRFRRSAVGVTADIRKAFLQIGIDERDRNFLKFLLKSDGVLSTYRHRRVVFGVCSSPFLLGAVIEHHLDGLSHDGDGSREAKFISQLKKSFYVDNCVTSLKDKNEDDAFKETAVKVMASAKFDLRDWMHTEEEDHSVQNVPSKVLGLLWNRRTDTLKISPDSLDVTVITTVTKRVILSVAQRVFDPVGFTCPVSLQPKLLLQELWNANLKWDDEVNAQIKNRFLCWYRELHQLFSLEVPRWVFGRETNFSIHVFTDASQDAYAAAVFVRVEEDEVVQVNLVAAKSRVAPLKHLTIPRLELLGALIGARLFKMVVDALEIPLVNAFFWSDSSTVIAWIERQEPWTIFIKNRVDEIRSLTTPGRWRHLPGSMNPADLPSRGCSVSQLIKSRWWEGPLWLKNPPEEWPQSPPIADEKEVGHERRKTAPTSCIALDGDRPDSGWTYRYFSIYSKIVRMIAWMIRFAENCRSSGERLKGDISAEEYSRAESRLISIVQKEVLKSDLSHLGALNIFKDHQGTLRVKTRLCYRDDLPSFKSPILLQGRHPVVTRLIRQTHLANQHIGVQGLLVMLREKFWLVHGRRVVRSVIRECVVCRRHNGKALEAPLSSLPKERVRDAAPFEAVGIDFAGPIFLRNGEKNWICLFTCSVIRAVHLELVGSMSSNDFLLALRRFIARRGRPSVIFTDNGSNFVGAYNLLKSVDWDEIRRYSSSRKIEWKFIPPSAPWWGGWWERLIRLMKQLLRKTLGRASVTQEEMGTLLAETEALINARPLTYVSEDPEDMTPLTPAMFLHPLRGSEVPDLHRLHQTPSGDLVKRFKYLARLRDEIIKRFRNEYLSQLTQAAGKRKLAQLRVGEIVLIGGDNVKRLDWPLAKILELMPGKDGHVRVVRLMTSTGELIRPIQRIYPLEMPRDEIEGISLRPISMETKQKTESPSLEDESPYEDVLEDGLTAVHPEDSTDDGPKTKAGRRVRPPKKLDL